MEEASTLANKVGIIAKRMLGTLVHPVRAYTYSNVASQLLERQTSW